MPTLLLQSVAPLQSWGTQSEYIMRDTGREPCKSGILGLLCAALGVPREDLATLAQLASLKMGVRVDREGTVLRDFHTATDKSGNKPSTTVSTRYYLSDAMFLVGLEGEIELLSRLQEALHRPKWTLFLGRKSCVPSRPPYIKDGLIDLPLLEALKNYAWLGENAAELQKLKKIRLVYEDPTGHPTTSDLPISFIRNHRTFQPRFTRTDFISPPPNTLGLSYPRLHAHEVNR